MAGTNDAGPQTPFAIRHSSFVIPPWLVSLLLFLALASAAVACRFNVRDIGFVNLEPNPYRLLVFINQATPAAFNHALRQSAETALRDANVELQLVNLDGDATSGARRLVEQHRLGEFPACVLVAPDQRSLALRLDPAGLAPEDFAPTALASVVSSPFREAVLKQAVSAYALVVVVESGDAALNREAHRVANESVAQLRDMMGRLPKAVRSPPQIVTLTRAEAERERLALWSLGLEGTGAEAPAIAVLHGRGKRIGPVLTGTDLRVPRLFHLLGVVGQDCECFLDRSWMQGPSLPLRWDKSMQKQVTENLGFDPESPLIKSEVAAILAKGPNPNARPVGLVGGTDADLLGYRELSLEEPSAPATNAVALDAPARPAPAASLGVSLAVLAGLALGGGAWLVLRRRNH